MHFVMNLQKFALVQNIEFPRKHGRDQINDLILNFISALVLPLYFILITYLCNEKIFSKR